MSSVRAFVQDDIPEVVALAWRFLQGDSGCPPPAMQDYFRELFFHGPFSDKSLPSLVYQNERGRVVGFLGILRRWMSLDGRRIKVALGTSLVVNPDSRSTMAGLKLIDHFLSGKQDLAMTDTANQATQRIWTRLGGSTASLYGMHWSRPLRPARYALYAISHLGRGPLTEAFVFGCKPVCKFVDAIAARMPSSPFRQRPSTLSAEELTTETLLACLHDLPEPHSLRPEYERDSMSWLLDFMGRMNAYGSLRTVLMRNRESKIVGWYMYYVKDRGVGQVVQIGALPSSVDAVLDHLSYDAWTHGAIALHGRLEPHLSQKLSGKYCFYFLGNRLLVYSRNPELARQIQSGSACLTRLDGEWCLKFGTPEPATRHGAIGYPISTANSGRSMQLVGNEFKARTSESASQVNTAW